MNWLMKFLAEHLDGSQWKCRGETGTTWWTMWRIRESRFTTRKRINTEYTSKPRWTVFTVNNAVVIIAGCTINRYFYVVIWSVHARQMGYWLCSKITHETVRVMFWVAAMTLDTNKNKCHRVEVRVDDKNVWGEKGYIYFFLSIKIHLKYSI